MYRIFLNILRYIEYLITIRPGEIRRDKGQLANRVILPLIRQAMPSVIASQIVGVQPTTMDPADLIKGLSKDKQDIMQKMLEDIKNDD